MLRYLATVAAAALQLFRGLVMLPFELLAGLGRLLGIAPPQIPPQAPSGPTPEDLISRLHERQNAPLPDYAPGAVVHSYAAAAPQERATVDLSPLTSAQMIWLLSLSDADLARLASAGPKACDRAAAGKRSGVVGLIPCRPAEPKANTGKRDREDASDYDLRPSLKMAA